ncbi:hypothetical protein V1264_012257 [Littorina saxatilis]|uniref:Myb/SANT-like DNA-binding domain-containing protein n=1 Tax=Littorina saxatilis TaxID=31220 RepID=A0AAN9GLS3_9CAEN
MAEYEDSLDYEEENHLQSGSCAFSDAELRALLMAYIDNIDLFERRHCPAAKEVKKAAAWQKLCTAVNACGQGSLRTIKSLKKKISDMKSSAKSWLRFQKNPPTGNRKGKTKLWYYDTVIDHVIGRDSPILDGVEGGSESGVSGLFGLTVVRKLNLGSATAQLMPLTSVNLNSRQKMHSFMIRRSIVPMLLR